MLKKSREHFLGADKASLSDTLQSVPEIQNKKKWSDAEIKSLLCPLKEGIQLCRKVVKACTQIKWINPAAVIVPVHPGKFTGQKSSWGETLDFSSWLPVHADSHKQISLIRAYFAANFANDEEADHISTHIIAQAKNGHNKGCFIATIDSSDELRVKSCCGKYNLQNVAAFNGKHYRKLFNKRPHENGPLNILFLPNRTLSYLQTSDSMYQEYLVGCYLGIKNSQICKNNFCSLPEEVKEFCDHLSLLMYMKARQKANTELHDALTKQAKSLDKYRRMFDLLTPPLHSLTAALAQTQADTQELRAILYEPMDAIFECQPLIAELFNEDRPIPGAGFRPFHQPEQYKKLCQAKIVLANALARFRGKGIHEQDILLDDEIKFYLQATDAKGTEHAYNELATCLIPVLGITSWDEFSGKITSTSNESEKLKLIIFILNRLKNRFSKPYKPGEANSALAWSIVSSFLKKTCDIKLLVKDKHKESENVIVVTKNSNPLCTHGHLIEFIAGAINYRQNQKSTQKTSVHILLNDCQVIDETLLFATTTEASCIFTIPGKVEWFQNKDGEMLSLADVINRELANKEDNVRYIGEYGDFHRPFVKFIRRLPSEAANLTEVSWDQTAKKLSICVGKRFEICLMNNDFKINTKCS